MIKWLKKHHIIHDWDEWIFLKYLDIHCEVGYVETVKVYGKYCRRCPKTKTKELK